LTPLNVQSIFVAKDTEDLKSTEHGVLQCADAVEALREPGREVPRGALFEMKNR
jgi:hypothetical protein